jgi:hypothetical protein
MTSNQVWVLCSILIMSPGIGIGVYFILILGHSQLNRILVICVTPAVGSRYILTEPPAPISLYESPHTTQFAVLSQVSGGQRMGKDRIENICFWSLSVFLSPNRELFIIQWSFPHAVNRLKNKRNIIFCILAIWQWICRQFKVLFKCILV